MPKETFLEGTSILRAFPLENRRGGGGGGALVARLLSLKKMGGAVRK